MIVRVGLLSVSAFFMEEIMKKAKIFLSGLKARVDEVLATALLIASKPDIEFTEIIRDESRLDEVGEDDFVIGCGLDFDGVRFFDHHIFESLVYYDSDLTLIAKAFAPSLLTDEKFGPLIERVCDDENFGNNSLEDRSDGAPQCLLGSVLLSFFERMPLAVATETAKRFRERLCELNEIELAEKWLEEHTGVTELFGVLDLLVCDKPPFGQGFSIAAYEAAIDKYMVEKKVHASYEWAGDGSDNRIIRVSNRGKECFDFRKVSLEHEVLPHKDGSMLVFKPADETEFKEVIRQAVGCLRKHDHSSNPEDNDKVIEFEFMGKKVFVSMEDIFGDDDSWADSYDDEDEAKDLRILNCLECDLYGSCPDPNSCYYAEIFEEAEEA